MNSGSPTGPLSRRGLFRRLAILGAVSATASPALSRAQLNLFRGETINARIRVQDEQGTRVPHVTVWYTFLLASEHGYPKSAFPTIDPEGLWRIAQRYRSTAELVSAGSTPVPALVTTMMSNDSGELRRTVDYRWLSGGGDRVNRPDPTVGAFVFLRRGYFPARLDFSVPRSESTIDATVTLRRDPGEPLNDTPYMAKYDRVRFVLSDGDALTAMTIENQQRIEHLRATLAEAAQEALAAGDRQSAARIYARMIDFPALEMVGGRIAGFKRSDRSSPESQQARRRAYELAPNDLFVWMNTMNLRVPTLTAGTPQERIRPYLAEVERLIAAHGEAVWPDFYWRRAYQYRVLEEFAKSRQLYLDAYKLEPSYSVPKTQIEDIKRDMRIRGLPIPADW